MEMFGKRYCALCGQAVRLVPDTDNASHVVTSAEVVRINLAAAMFGLTRKAIERKISSGTWLEGRHYHRAPDGGLWINRGGVEEWVKGDPSIRRRRLKAAGSAEASPAPTPRNRRRQGAGT